MKIEEYYNKIVKAIDEHGLSNPNLLKVSGHLYKYLNEVMGQEIDNSLKMTRMTILLEGFYRSIPEQYALKNKLNLIRLERWYNHYGTPTITFLLTYNSEIKQTQQLFDLTTSVIDKRPLPWQINKPAPTVKDETNNVIVNEQSYASVTMPAIDEKAGELLKTYNPSGGFTTTPCDPVSQNFIEYAANGRTVLEIGAAFGAASLQALAKGATVFCNDIEPSNLAVVRNRYLQKSSVQKVFTSGDCNKLVLVPGSFPDELASLPKNFFDAILICRVLHFFSGSQIEKALQQLSDYLKPGGKLFIVCETPFLKNWQKFIPEYEKRVEQGVKWPGEITNPSDFENSGRSASLPKFVHWITKEPLERSLTQSKFGVEHLSYIDRCGQFPSDLLLDGRESIGAVAAKPY